MNISTVVNFYKNKRNFSIMCFSLFSAWLLSFPFQGQILYGLAESAGIEVQILSLIVIITQFMGLFASGFIIKSHITAKTNMSIIIVVCISGSLIFFLEFSFLWLMASAVISFFGGLFIGSWGLYFEKYCTSSNLRLKTSADVLVYSNILMIIINIITVNFSVFAGLTISIICLIASLFFIFRLEDLQDEKGRKRLNEVKQPQRIPTLSKPFIVLCIFILIITINSGFMYQVVNPGFSHFKILSSYYWAIPYVGALLAVRNISNKINRAYVLYIALIMIGLSFVAFMWLDRSALSYIVIDSLMMGAFGVCDLFWWFIIASFFDYYDNPVKILGIGLSMNVLGILIGGVMGNIIVSYTNSYFEVSFIALIVIFMVMVILPVLNSQLTVLLKNHVFLVEFSNMKDDTREKNLSIFKEIKQLTQKETEVVNLLLRGYTYKVIAENLFISENTMKFHIKNIYQKLNVKNKMELIKMFMESEK